MQVLNPGFIVQVLQTEEPVTSSAYVPALQGVQEAAPATSPEAVPIGQAVQVDDPAAPAN